MNWFTRLISFGSWQHEPLAPQPNPPEPSQDEVDWDWMVSTFPVGKRIDYLNRVLLVGQYRRNDYGVAVAGCEYADDNGRLRDWYLSLDQLKAIHKRDNPS